MPLKLFDVKTLQPATLAVPPRRAAGAFYGRRKAKPLKAAQAELLQTRLPELLLDLSKPPPESIGKLLPHNPAVNTLEIGFGGGEHLVQRAGENPNEGYLGVEPFINGMGKALTMLESEGLKNICLFDEDATLLLDWLPAGSIDFIYLLYPDPWHKKRHWKRRFVNPDNLKRFSRILSPGGQFRFASDITGYVNWTLQHCEESKLFELLGELNNGGKMPWRGWVSTRYERKAIREGRSSTYLTFTKSE